MNIKHLKNNAYHRIRFVPSPIFVDGSGGSYVEHEIWIQHVTDIKRATVEFFSLDRTRVITVPFDAIEKYDADSNNGDGGLNWGVYTLLGSIQYNDYVCRYIPDAKYARSRKRSRNTASKKRMRFISKSDSYESQKTLSGSLFVSKEGFGHIKSGPFGVPVALKITDKELVDDNKYHGHPKPDEP